jgi:hypothetical protein
MWESLECHETQLMTLVLRYILLAICKHEAPRVRKLIDESDEVLLASFWRNVRCCGTPLYNLDAPVIYAFFSSVCQGIQAQTDNSLHQTFRQQYPQPLDWTLSEFRTKLAFVAFRFPAELVGDITRWPSQGPGTAAEAVKVLRSLRSTPLGLEEGLAIPLSKVSVSVLWELRDELYV